MRRIYILVEGPTDAEFLRRILPEDVLGDVELVDAGGNAGIPSLARSLIVRRNRPVAVLMDSDSLDTDMIEERQQSTEELIQAANGSIPIKVVLAIPEIEAWFFAAPELIERILGGKAQDEWLSFGKRDPKGVLQQLAENANKKWDTNQAINALDSQDIERIRAVPEVAELISFLQAMQTQYQKV
jgi:hypothetical protein